MFPHSLHILRTGRASTHSAICRRISIRHASSSAADGPRWFQDLRSDMLSRDIVFETELVTPRYSYPLSQTLQGFLPRSWVKPVDELKLEGYLTNFNHSVTNAELLPDGTDSLQSPGEPWMRRLWAGGSIRLNTDTFSTNKHGFWPGAKLACFERITDVQLRGAGDAEKLFVNIERQLMRLDSAFRQYVDGQDLPDVKGMNIIERCKQNIRYGNETIKPILKEERTLVFLKERKREEIAGETAAIKYLDRPGTPDFSHTLTPTQTLLFRFSALTFNSHLIHLDRDYVRKVEGHRNLLVHGPLSLTLMVSFMRQHLKELSVGARALSSIEYRNLAPLYCDEPMTLCARKRSYKDSPEGSTFEVWIEGPTGGVAMKGTVHTHAIPTPKNADLTNPVRSMPKTGVARRVEQTVPVIRYLAPGLSAPHFKKPAFEPAIILNQRKGDTSSPIKRKAKRALRQPGPVE